MKLVVDNIEAAFVQCDAHLKTRDFLQLAQALQAAGGKPALVSDRALWQTLRKFFRPGQAEPAGEEV